MITNIEYALMAGASYISNRPDKNQFPAPDGWTATQYDIKANGFEAISFVKGNEIVISFAGTDFSNPSAARVGRISLRNPPHENATTL